MSWVIIVSSDLTEDPDVYGPFETEGLASKATERVWRQLAEDGVDLDRVSVDAFPMRAVLA